MSPRNPSAALVVCASLVLGIALQGCGSGTTSTTTTTTTTTCVYTDLVVHRLNVNPSGAWGSATLSELLVDALSVRVVSELGDSKQPQAGPQVDYSSCGWVTAVVANGDVEPDGHGTHQLMRLTLGVSPAARSTSKEPLHATVYNVSMNQLVATHGGTIVVDKGTIYGYGSDAGNPLNITASGARSSVTLHGSVDSTGVTEAEILAEQGGSVDLGSNFGNWDGLLATITASDVGSVVTGSVNGQVTVQCNGGGRIAVKETNRNGTSVNKECGGAASAESSLSDQFVV